MKKKFLKKIADHFFRITPHVHLFTSSLLHPFAPSPLHLFAICLLLLSTACARRHTEKELTVPQALAKLQSCAPAAETDENLKITIGKVNLLPDETDVRIAAQVQNEAIDFDLPTYSLSRGRWLINEKGRAYLLDEKCREYKLKDRRPSGGQTIPQNGRIRLNPGESFEAVLVFPSFLEKPRVGMLIYGGRSLPFALGDAANGVATGAGK